MAYLLPRPRWFNTAGPCEQADLYQQHTNDTGQPVLPEAMDRASLAERLREPRVRRIIAPMLAGLTLGNVAEDDLRFVQDLGRVRMASAGGLETANPLYRARLASAEQVPPEHPSAWERLPPPVDDLRTAPGSEWAERGVGLLP